jgi:cold shock CspA family protein
MTEENKERIVGSELGQVKWFDNKLGYGFITVLTNEHKGVDIFVHQTNISPLETEFRTLMKGEYVSLNVSDDGKVQAINITGVLGGSLRCDEPRLVSKRNGGSRRPERENSVESN